jgi:hypothetical protein
VNMPEKGGQDRQAPLHILSGAILLNQSLDRKAVAEVMKAWAMAGTRRPQSSSLGEGIERPPDSTGFQLCSSSGYEEERSRPSSQESGTMCRVVAEHPLGRCMNGHETRLAKLRTSNGKNALRQIHIFVAQVESFADTQTGYG